MVKLPKQSWETEIKVDETFCVRYKYGPKKERKKRKKQEWEYQSVLYQWWAS